MPNIKEIEDLICNIELRPVKGRFFLYKDVMEKKQERHVESCLTFNGTQYYAHRNNLAEFDKLYMIATVLNPATEQEKLKSECALCTLKDFLHTQPAETAEALEEAFSVPGLMFGRGCCVERSCFAWTPLVDYIDAKNEDLGLFINGFIVYDPKDAKPVQLSAAQRKKEKQENLTKATMSLMKGYIEKICKKYHLELDPYSNVINWNSYELNTFLVNYLKENAVKELEALGLQNVRQNMSMRDSHGKIFGWSCINLDKVSVSEEMLKDKQ